MLVSCDILKFAQQIEFKVKKLLAGTLAGGYKNKTKGFGLDFYQLREYQLGDDIRYIDWKSSAKTSNLLVKEYLDDRNRTVYIFVDLSASMFYGSNNTLKFNLASELVLLLSFIFFYSKDSVGLVLFTDKIELFMPAKLSRAYIINMIKALFKHKIKSKKTNLNSALKFISQLKTKKALICLISDFLSDFDKKLISIVSRQHEIIMFKCSDERELTLPNIGILNFKDIETGKFCSINTNNINKNLLSWRNRQENLIKIAKVNCFNAIVSRSFIFDLIRFLKQRISN